MPTTSGLKTAAWTTRRCVAYHAALQAYGWLLTTPGAPLLYYGDEYGEYGGADPDNRHVSQRIGMERQRSPSTKTSRLGQLRLDSIALRQGVFHTPPMANLLVYNMTHDDQTMSVVLNRGGPTQVGALMPTIRSASVQA